MEVEILDTQVLYQNGSFMRIRRWLKGVHPTRGQITKGYTGWETVEEIDVIKPMHVFRVVDKEAQ